MIPSATAHSAVGMPDERPGGWIGRHPLLAFVALTYGLTWPWMLLDVLASLDVLPFQAPLALLVLQGYGPTFAALIVVGVTRGRVGIRALLQPLCAWRVGLRWYALVLLGVGALAALTFALYGVIGGPPLNQHPVTWALLANALALFLIGGALNGEEIGWRGYALPLLQARHGALRASLILGVVWALFHAPQFFISDGAFAGTPPPAFAARTVAMAILFTWVYNHTRGSLLIAYVLHASINTWTRVIPVDAMVGPYAWLPAILFCLAAALVLGVSGPQLGYRSSDAT